MSNSKRQIKVRFHLAQGQHYMHWQIKDGGRTHYADPTKVSLVLSNARLCNQVGTAKRIHEGGNKTVCAWILAESVETEPLSNFKGTEVAYNPRVSPNWRDGSNNNLDGRIFDKLITVGKRVFAPLVNPLP